MMAAEGEGAALDEADPPVPVGRVSNPSGQDAILSYRANGDPLFAFDAFATGSPMWGRQGGLGLFSPQRNGPAIVIDVDRAGNIRAITDALGNRAGYGYDLAGNVTSVTDPNGDATHFSYDSAGRLTAVVDALFNETDFSYDDAGLVSAETIVIDGETMTRTYDHDDSGNVVRKVDRNGRVTVFVYDPSGRMTEEIWYTSAADADGDVNRLNTITWTYDEAGNLTSVADNSSCYVYAYDAQGRVLSQSVMPIGGPVTVLTIGYGTREDDLPISLSATVDGVADFLTSFEYDCQGRVVAIRQTGQGAREVAEKYVTFAYADTGALERIVRYESLDTSRMVAVSEYRYDQFGRLVSLDHFQNADDPLAGYTWTYEGGGLAEVNSAGNQDNPLAGFGFSLDSLLASTTEARVNPLPDHVWTFNAAFTGLMTRMTSPDGVAAYSYDARGQLTGASYDYQPGESYSYDANGNRTNPGYVTGAYNRLLSDGTYNYEYDAEGNRTKRTDIASGAVTEYIWDHRNRLVAVIDRASDGGPILQSVAYVYDSQNRWIAKSIDADGEGPDEATSTYFVYDGNQIILQIGAEGQVTNRYLWGPAVDQILADEQVQFDGSSAVLWTLTDHLNTVRDLAALDNETGVTTIANHIVYDAFGRVTGQTDPAVTTLVGFTARPFDRDTGLQNNLNRWYDAETATWISEDPIAFAAADANLYRYVGNSPRICSDPTGLASGDVGFVIIWIDSASLPSNFDVKAVQDEMREILRKSGVLVNVTLLVTTRPKEDLSLGWHYQYDHMYLFGTYGWINLNPLWYIVAPSHDTYAWLLRQPLHYEHHVRFDSNGRYIGNTIGALTKVNPKTTGDSLPNVPGATFTQTYANILLHEVFWLGLLGKSDDTGRPVDTLPRPEAPSNRDVIIPPWIADLINEALTRE
ncbi:MAG: RHS repeat-associated core domain-containing protein [Thermoguttaceae bacterium]